MGGENLWDAIGAIAELLGATGVLLTLIYLSRQIRQNTQQTKNSTIESLMAREVEARQMLIDGEIPRIRVAVLAGETLSEEDRLRHAYFLQTFVQQWESAFHLHQRGALPDDVFTAIEFRRLAIFATLPKEYGSWADISDGYTPAFQAHVNQVLKPSKDGGQTES